MRYCQMTSELILNTSDRKPSNQYNEICQQTVPEAIVCFLGATGFEDAIRNAISIGGDSDTLAAITGSIAEGRWGVPEGIRREAARRLDTDLSQILDRFEKRQKSL